MGNRDTSPLELRCERHREERGRGRQERVAERLL